MDSHRSISQWLNRIKQGDQTAVQKVWEQYYDRLVGLARRKLRDFPKRVCDEEDVVITAFDSFYRGAQAGRFPKLEDRSDLWQILVMITVRKALNHMNHERRQKRGGGHVRGESAFLGPDELASGIEQIAGTEPSPEFAGQIVDQCQYLLRQLDDDLLERIAIAKLEGHTNAEIADQLSILTRTVERKLRIIREIWADEAQ